jgi:hypothetical protein
MKRRNFNIDLVGLLSVGFFFVYLSLGIVAV